jgi:adenine-specific DNA-methyltransferase
MLMDEVFGEENRIGILNWQKAAAARPDNSHISSATEYVLIYSKDTDTARTYSLDRSEQDNRRYGNPDHDLNGVWREGNLTARTYSAENDYGIQSPFTGEVHYPAGNGAWRHPKRNVLGWLGEWGVPYEIRSIKDGKRPALMVTSQQPGEISATHAKAARKRLESGPWPFVWFGTDGIGRPRVKTYLERIRKGKVPTTYWASEDLTSSDVPLVDLGSTSWDYTESGRSADGVSELTAIVGKGHGFDTVKPLKLFKKIIQLWCPPQGLVLDPYAGSGTTGQAVLEMNQEADAERRFILIEQGSPATGDKYARSLTWRRLHNVITGQRPGPDGKLKNSVEPVPGGFEFRMLTRQIDAKTVLSMKKDELVDVVITSHWDLGRRGSMNLIRIDDPKYSYLVGRNEQGEGYFIIWNNGGPVGQLDRESYRVVLKDAEKAGIKPPYHVYARYEVYQSRNVQFWKIPDKILAHLGLNENSDRFNDDEISD